MTCSAAGFGGRGGADHGGAVAPSTAGARVRRTRFGGVLDGSRSACPLRPSRCPPGRLLRAIRLAEQAGFDAGMSVGPRRARSSARPSAGAASDAFSTPSGEHVPPGAAMSVKATSDLWWKDAIVYCLDVETFFDSDGDGCGDLPG